MKATTNLPKPSKNKLRKINADGIHGGKNITVFDEKGKPVVKEEYERKKYLESLE